MLDFNADFVAAITLPPGGLWLARRPSFCRPLMSELATHPNTRLQIPNINAAFIPNLQLPNWKPEDFEAAYQFGPKPIAPDTYSKSVDQLCNTLNNLLDPQQRLLRQQAQSRLSNLECAPHVHGRAGGQPERPQRPEQRAAEHAAHCSDLQPFGRQSRAAHRPGGTGTSSRSERAPNLTGNPATASTPASAGPTPTVPASQVGAVSNASAPDANGFHMTLGTTFATPDDLTDFAKHHSLATAEGRMDLQVHHVVYISCLSPWDYPDELLLVLCDWHHKARQAVEQAIYVEVGMHLATLSTCEFRRQPIYTFFEEDKHAAEHPSLAARLFAVRAGRRVGAHLALPLSRERKAGQQTVRFAGIWIEPTS